MLGKQELPGSETMVKPFIVAVLLALAGCSAVPRRQEIASPCHASEASYECQVERYQNVNVQ
jgi:hypothetical protein